MLKNFKSGYAVSGSSEIASTEKNDCVVRAIANACDENYDQAHKYVADTFDRKKGKGTTQMMSTLDNVKEMTFDEVGQLDLFSDGITRKLKMFGHGPKQGGDMVTHVTIINLLHILLKRLHKILIKVNTLSVFVDMPWRYAMGW